MRLDSLPAAGETIGERLKRLRLERGFSQRELAAPGVSYAYISRIEAGTRQPSVKALRRLAVKLNVSADYLERGSDLDPEAERELRLSDLELAIRLGEWRRHRRSRCRRHSTKRSSAGDRAATLRGRVALATLAQERREHARAVGAARSGARKTSRSRRSTGSTSTRNLGRAYTEAGRPQDAVDLFERCIDGVRARRRHDDRNALRRASELRAERHGRARTRGGRRSSRARPRRGQRRPVHARAPLLVDGAARARRRTRVRRAHERPQGDRAAAGDRRHLPSRARAHPRGLHHALARRPGRRRAPPRPGRAVPRRDADGRRICSRSRRSARASPRFAARRTRDRACAARAVELAGDDSPADRGHRACRARRRRSRSPATQPGRATRTPRPWSCSRSRAAGATAATAALAWGRMLRHAGREAEALDVLDRAAELGMRATPESARAER